MPELSDLPDLGPIDAPELEPWERMNAAGHRLSAAADVAGVPMFVTQLLMNMSANLTDAARVHRDHLPAGHTCQLEHFADALLGWEARRG